VAAVLYQRILERVRALPDVVKAAAVEDLPITDGNSMWSMLVDGAPQTTVANAPAAMPQKVTPDYFETMGVRLLRGRTFTEADRVDAPLVAIVNETMEQKLWPGKSAIGGTLKLLAEELPWATVVGVVRDVRSRGFLNEVPPTMYFPQAQAGRSAWYVPSQMWIVARNTRRAVGDRVQCARHHSRTGTERAIARVQTMDEAVAASVASRRFTTSLIAGFALIAVLLAGLGVYGVITYSVNQRQFRDGHSARVRRDAVPRREPGPGRRAADRGDRSGDRARAGMGSDASALVHAREREAGRPAHAGGGHAGPAAVALLAAWLPARRASAVDPAKTIRAE
jgi:hypothetical protein